MISIGLPAYKPFFLEKAIASVLNQTYNDFELIIVDDASPYDLNKIVTKFPDPRIRFYRNNHNLGKESIVKNWNQTLQYARGAYFVLFSDDDLYHKDFLKELINLTERYPDVSLFHSRVVKINPLDNVIGYTPTCPEYETALEFIWHTMHGYRNLYATEFLCKTETLKEIGGFYDLPLAWGSDYVTWFKLSQRGGIVYSAKLLACWRSSENNISTTGNYALRLQALDGYRKWMIGFFEHYQTHEEAENEKLKQCKAVLETFFSKKREYLLLQEITNKGFLRAIFQSPFYSIKYNLSLAKVLYYLIKSLYSTAPKVASRIII